MKFSELAHKRYSCKSYDGRPVDDETLTKILEAGRLAPTAKNRQEQHVYVVRSTEGLEKIDEITPCRYNASVVLMITYDKNDVYVFPSGGIDSGMEDGSIVATYMMLAAADLDVDSCWVNRFDPDTAARLFGLPENEQVFMLLDLGYAAEDGGPLPNHFKRKDLSETVTYR